MSPSPSLFTSPFPPAPPSGPLPENRQITSTIRTLNLQRHIEGGYFTETDRNTTQIPNPFLHTSTYPLGTNATSISPSSATTTRDTSTTIYYLITPNSPIGYFHRNKGRTVHVHHRGRARYVIIHADEVGEQGAPGQKQRARIETFTVGPDIEAGEKLQWIVEGGKFKASFLLPDDDDDDDRPDSSSGGPFSANGCLITEVVTPGFEYSDHDFMTRQQLEDLVDERDFAELSQFLRKGERPTEAELQTKITDRK